jgi:TonB family protein
MFKIAFVFLLGLMRWFVADAQISERDTLFSYMKNSGKVVDNKDSADYSMAIFPADSSTGIWAYPVTQFYLNGKIKMRGYTGRQLLPLKLQGNVLNFYENGRRKSIINHEEGVPVGDAFYYYPNGKTWKLITYIKEKPKQPFTTKSLEQQKNYTLLKECRDSTGKILTEKGNGMWLDFDDKFEHKIAEGEVANTREEGQWHGTLSDTTSFKCVYKTGEVVGIGYGYDKSGNKYPFTNAIVLPQFPKGLAEFGKFLGKTIRYPAQAIETGVSGKVFMNFVVEKNGRLTDINILTAPSPDLGAEALRVLKLSPKWVPGYEYGFPHRVSYTVPISFSLD